MLCLLSFGACSGVDAVSNFNPARGEAYPENPCGAPYVDPDDAVDTLLLISAVTMARNYDWHRDTAMGNAEGTLVVLRNMEVKVMVPVGASNWVSSDPDTHHFVDGHLFTEFSSGTQTVIKKDGAEVARYDGREYLLGLYPKDGDVYTVSADRSGNGFSYRKNGKILLSSPTGTVYGDMQDTSYPESGALYEDSGKLCFSYYETYYGQRLPHIVIDGEDKSVEMGTFSHSPVDIKIIGGLPRALFVFDDFSFEFDDGIDYTLLGNGYVWSAETRIYPLEGHVGVAGPGVSRYSPDRQYWLSWEEGVDEIWKRTYTGKEYLYWKNGEKTFFPLELDDWYVFTRNCAAIYDGVQYQALTPKKGGKPVIRCGDNDIKVNVDGYLTGIYYRSSLPR